MAGGANCRQRTKQLTEAGKPNDEAPDALKTRREGDEAAVMEAGQAMPEEKKCPGVYPRR
jgi:hypothetical protein